MIRLMSVLVVLIVATVLFAVRSINVSDTEMYVLPDEYLGDYVMTLESEGLAKDFESRFHSMIENVSKVDAHYKAKVGLHYLVAYGKKNGENTVVLVKASKEDILNSTLSGEDCGPHPYCEWENQECVPLVSIGILCGCYINSSYCFIWP